MQMTCCLNVGSLPDRRFNFINATEVEENGKQGINVFRVDGEGPVYRTIVPNKTGYAELYEWADLNQERR